MSKKCDYMRIRLDTIPALDGQTDRRICHDNNITLVLNWRADARLTNVYGAH